MLSRFDMNAADIEEPFCNACTLGKIHQLPFSTSTSVTEAIGELVQSDICEPMMLVSSLGGFLHFLLVKDDFSHFHTLYFIKNKSEVEHCLEGFLKKSEKLCPEGIRILRIDNGLEYCNQTVEKLLHHFGVTHQHIVIYTPEQNSVAERENKTLVEVAPSLLHTRGLDPSFWAEAASTAGYVLNLYGASRQKDMTPFEL